MAVLTGLMAGSACNAQTAPASVITLGSVACNPGNCANVPNDGGVTVDYMTLPIYASYKISINGDLYMSAYGAYTENQPAIANVPVYDAAGNTLFVSAIWTTKRVCNGSGHPVCRTNWTLVGGTITKP